jgi:hypothetical protein
MIVNFGLVFIVSLATAPSPRYVQEMVDQLRIPVGEMIIPAGSPAAQTTAPAASGDD